MYCEEEPFLDDENELYWLIAMQSIQVVNEDTWTKLVHNNRAYMKFNYAFQFVDKTDNVDDIITIRTFVGNACYEWGADNKEMWLYHLHEACDYIQTKYN